METDRSGLVAGFVGQTATKVVAAFDAADQGTLLIDEAYSLIRGGDNDFGREAIDTIVKLVEDRRDRLVVILTGYTGEMAELVAANPGMKSRFPKSIHFPDYSTEELVAILRMTASKGRYELTPEAETKAAAWLDAIPRDEGLRQRPPRAQPVRDRRRAPGHPAGLGRAPHRRAAAHAGGRRLPRARRTAVAR